VGSSPSWRTRLNLIFSIQKLPILEAFVVCTYGQMWTKRDKNRTQNRTQLFLIDFAVLQSRIDTSLGAYSNYGKRLDILAKLSNSNIFFPR